jgi:hypothetical protein
MNENRATFLKFSEEVTGYSSLDLEGTGLVDVYQTVVEGAIGETLAAQFYALTTTVGSPVDPLERDNELTHQTQTAREGISDFDCPLDPLLPGLAFHMFLVLGDSHLHISTRFLNRQCTRGDRF